MALFYATIRGDSDSLLEFHFLAHLQVFSSEISLVSRLNNRYVCFYSHFCFLVIVDMLNFTLPVMFLFAVTSF